MTNTLKTMNEEQLRAAATPWPKTEEELVEVVRSVGDREHDYGTCVYAMSIAAVAAMNYVASKLGVTGFQASCAQMDIIRRERGWQHGFMLINYENLLYPQYDEQLRVSPEKILADPKNRKYFAQEALKLLATDKGSESVRAHWEKLARMEN